MIPKDIITLKFRPQTFDELKGQPQVSIPLINSIKSGKIHHAYLFYGPRGIGKTSAARILAKMLNCFDAKNGTICSQCENCREITNGLSPDVIEIDGASNRGINEIRQIQETLIYTPIKSKYKVYIIDEVHMLTKEAFNALLKTLEEPPDHVVFIFATTEVHRVLPTIRSRCQQYQFNLFKISDIMEQIAAILNYYSIKYDERVPFLIAKHGNGSMRDAESILSHVISYNDKEIKEKDIYYLLGIQTFDYILQLVKAIAEKKHDELYRYLSQLYLRGANIDNITQQFLEFLRILALVKNQIEDISILNETNLNIDELRKLSDVFSLKQLTYMAQKIIEYQKDASVYGNPFLAFENIIVSFSFDDFFVSTSELIDKLEDTKNVIMKAGSIQEKRIIVNEKRMHEGSLRTINDKKSEMNDASSITIQNLYKQENEAKDQNLDKENKKTQVAINEDLDKLLRIDESILIPSDKSGKTESELINKNEFGNNRGNDDKDSSKNKNTDAIDKKDISDNGTMHKSINDNADKNNLRNDEENAGKNKNHEDSANKDNKNKKADHETIDDKTIEKKVEQLKNKLEKKIEDSDMPDLFKPIAKYFNGKYDKGE